MCSAEQWEFVENKALLEQEGKYLRLHKATSNTECVCMSHSSILMIPSAEAPLTLKRSAGF